MTKMKGLSAPSASFADDTNLRGMIDIPEGPETIQKNLDKLKK